MAPVFTTIAAPRATTVPATPASAPESPIVLVHGFTQTGACWGPIGNDLERDHRVVYVDAPGHGRSDPDHDDATLWEAADLLASSAGRGTWIGYSMGGRLALHVALAHPDVVDRLVLIGTTPGIDDRHEREARRAADEALADRIETIGTAAFLDEWLALPLFAGLPAEAACLPDRLANRAEGLAASLRHAGTGTQDRLRPRLGELSMPVLWLAGADDPKFAAIGQDASISCPSATFATVPDAGHTAHLERPDSFLTILRPWLAASA